MLKSHFHCVFNAGVTEYCDFYAFSFLDLVFPRDGVFLVTSDNKTISFTDKRSRDV
jgi:hypothetical protein